MKNSRERILNAFLDEMLNDSRPGRSAEEMLRNINAQMAKEQAADESSEEIESPSTGPSLPTPALPSIDTAIQNVDRQAPPQATIRNLATADSDNLAEQDSGAKFDFTKLLSIVAIVIAGAFLSYVVYDQVTDKSGTDIANVDKSEEDNTPRARVAPRPNNDDRLAQNPNPVTPVQPNESVDPQPQPNTSPSEAQIVSRDDIPEDQTKLILPPEFTRTRNVSVVAVDSNGMANSINSALRKTWQVNDVKPAQPLELRNWANRLANRLIGRTFNADELQQVNGMLVQTKPAVEIRRDLIDFLIETPKFRSEFNEYWGKAIAWDLLGISQSMTADDIDMLQTRSFITDKIANDRPMDEVAYELLSAVGSTDRESERYNPAASYMVGLTKRFSKRQPAVGHVAESFMGQSMQCAQCHNTNQAIAQAPTQEDFYQFRSFFAQMRFEKDGEEAEDNAFYVVNRNYLPLGGEGRVEAAFKYKDLQGNEFEAFPEVGDLQLGSNGFVEKVDRRSQLASYIANSDEFASTMVDHVWTNMLNIPIRGLEGNADPSLAEMRSELANQLAANDFKLTWLVKSIAASDAFAVGVGTEEQLAADNPFLGASPTFNHFYHRIENRRSAIQSLAIVSNAYRSGDIKPALSAGLLARVDGSATEAKPNTILPFVPDKDSEWATSPSVSAQLDLIAKSAMSDEEKVKHLMLAALGREARDDEVQQAMTILNAADNKRTALQDVWWSLLNSVEYRLPRSASSGIR